MSKEEASRYWTRNNYSNERMVFSILIGYLSSLGEMADEYNDQTDDKVSLDLTYDTVANLTTVLAYQYFAYVKSGSSTTEKAIEIAKKTLAAYMMLLCMNEHMCFPTVSVSASGVFRIRISRLVELYKQMCGVDLREKGLDGFEATAN